MGRSRLSGPTPFGVLAILIGVAAGGCAALDDAFDRKPVDDQYVDEQANRESLVDFYNTWFANKTHPPM